MQVNEGTTVSQEGSHAVPICSRYWNSLRGRITIVSIVALALVTVALVFSSQTGQRRTVEQLSLAKQASDRLMFEKVVSYQLSILEERLTHIISPPLVKALRSADIDTLREYALPPFNRLSSLINMTKLSFYLSPNVAIFHAHNDTREQPETTPRALISEAFSRRTLRVGLERHGNEIDLTVAWPVYSEGSMVGIVAVSGGLRPILEGLKKTLDADLAVVADDPETGLVQVLVHSGDVMPTNIFALITSTLLNDTRNSEAGTRVQKDRDGKHWEMHISPITGGDGFQIGWLWVGRDASELVGSLLRNTIVEVVIAVTVTAAALTLILFNVAKVFGGLDRMVAAIQEFSRGKWDVTIPPSQDDEVGRLGSALQQMVCTVGETQRRLEQSERDAKAASTAKSVFIANMSHELRTPLNAILGYADLLRDDLASHGLERSVADMGRIHEAARGLLAIINDLLDIAKLDSGKMQVESVPVRVGALIRELESELGDQVRRNGNEFVVKVDQAHENVLADPARLKQALRNIIQNAGKFTHRGTVEVLVNSTSGADGQIRFVVRDTGIGVPVEALPRLFKPFSQVDGSTSRRFGGLGIGLAISRELCDLMGGRLDLETKPGTGTTVTILMPRAQRSIAAGFGRMM